MGTGLAHLRSIFIDLIAEAEHHDVSVTSLGEVKEEQALQILARIVPTVEDWKIDVLGLFREALLILSG